MASIVHRSVPTNLKWFPTCSHAHAMFQDRFKDAQVGSRWFSRLYILSPNFHRRSISICAGKLLFFRPSPLRLSPGRHTVFVLINELAKCKQRPSLGSQKRSADHYAVRSLVRPINEKQHKPNNPKTNKTPKEIGTDHSSCLSIERSGQCDWTVRPFLPWEGRKRSLPAHFFWVPHTVGCLPMCCSPLQCMTASYCEDVSCPEGFSVRSPGSWQGDPGFRRCCVDCFGHLRMILP